MRRFFLSLLIGLTFLRGMVGDVMAVQMVSMPHEAATNAIHSVAALADSSGEIVEKDHINTMSMPCHESSQLAQSDDELTTANECTVCQVCHLQIVLTTLAFDLPHAYVYGVATPVPRIWQSASLALTSKPPIS